MADKVGQLVVEMAANMARFESDMKHANRISQDTMRKIGADVDHGVGMMKRSMSGMAGVIAGVLTVDAAISFTREVAQAALAAEKLNMQFKASTGNAQAAAREMGYIRDVSDKLGLNFQSTATAYSKFLASTRGTSIEGQQSQKVFEGVTEAVTALGLSTDEASGIFLALSQMMSKGKVSAEELTGQLNERLPGATKMAADALGVTTGELLKMMQEGKVLSADLLPKLADQLHKAYGSAAEEAAHKGQAGINRFKNEVSLTAQEIGGVLMPAINAASNKLADMLKMMRDTSSTKFINDEFALPEDAAFVQRNRARIGKDIDPQMSRIAADRASEQERINASRAAAEKHAAGAAEREKAAKKAAQEAKRTQDEAEKRHSAALAEQLGQMAAFEAAQKSYNDLLRDQNKLLEDGLKGWDDLALNASVIKGGLLTAPTPAKTKFSLMGGDSTLYNGNGQITPPVDYAAAQRAAQELRDINQDTASVRANTPNIFGDTNISSQMKAEYDRQQSMYDDLMLAQDVYTEEGLTKYQAYADQREAIDKKYIAEKKALEHAQWNQSAEIISSNMDTIARIMMDGSKEQFEAGKKFAIASALIDTYLAASAAFASGTKAAPGPWGVALGVASAAVAVGAGMANVAAIESQRYEGREKGGPVKAGQTYVVGEKRPELFTPNQSGYITPYVPSGGQKVEVTQVFQVSPGLAGAVQAEIQRAAPYLMELSIQGVKSAMRNGEFQGV